MEEISNTNMDGFFENTENETPSLYHLRTLEQLRRVLGPLLREALDDPQTVEIIVNPDGGVWKECLGKPMVRIGKIPTSQTDAIIRTVSGSNGKVVTQDSPLLEGVLLLDGSRFSAAIPPVVSAHAFCIRKKAGAVFTLKEYVAQEIMTDTQAETLKQAVADHRNILVIGRTGSGKTTLSNALIHEMVSQNPDERMCVIEDISEIQCSAKNCVIYRTSQEMDMTALLRAALRMRPDRILVGDVRGQEALDLLDAWNAGHEGGIATLHANNAASALLRLNSLASRNLAAPREIDPLIAAAVHLIVHIAQTSQGRRVRELLKVQGFKQGEYQLQPLQGD